MDISANPRKHLDKVSPFTCVLNSVSFLIEPQFVYVLQDNFWRISYTYRLQGGHNTKTENRFFNLQDDHIERKYIDSTISSTGAMHLIILGHPVLLY